MKIKIIFICHGNICRSPMAEFIFKKLAKDENIESKFDISSRATSTEELGNPIHYGTKEIFRRENIPFEERYAKQITREECDNADLLICMDKKNIRNMAPFIGENREKLHTLMQYCGEDKDVSDPWWTGNFDEPYDDIIRGCKALMKQLKKNFTTFS